MSEKGLWEWVNKKMDGYPGWQGDRLENCSSTGIPDSVISFEYAGKKVTTFMELKDWSAPKKHPLLLEQYNFLTDHMGVVLILDKKDLILCNAIPELMSSNLKRAREAGQVLNKSNFSGGKFAAMVMYLLQDSLFYQKI